MISVFVCAAYGSLRGDEGLRRRIRWRKFGEADGARGKVLSDAEKKALYDETVVV
jgi:hypothetical protein